MVYDLVIRGGQVVDGTGLPAFQADVAVADGRIARIGRVDAPARRSVDAEGLWVTPGFIDVHTHYDVQLDWDPIASPAPQHGVTTVLTGNCGFTLYPAKPADVSWLAGMLSRVEGMSKPAMEQGFRFGGGGFEDFWKRLDGRLGLNVGGYVGHSALRRYVMGEAGSEREARADEIEAMQELLRDGMREGAVGFSTSQLEVHVGEDGREVPSNFAAPEEIIALSAALAGFDHGAIEIIPRSFAEGYDEADRELLYEMAKVSGKPIELAPLAPPPQHPMGWERTLELVREARERGVRLHPQFTTQRLGLHLRLRDTFVFDEMPSWREALTLPVGERERALRDPSWRARLRSEYLQDTKRSVAFDLSDLEVEGVRDPEHVAWVGRSVAEFLDEGEEDRDALDVFLDMSLAEDLETVWRIRTSEVAQKFIDHVVRTSIQDPLVMAGSSDGGAHLASFVGADFTTLLLSDWVPDPLSLEHAVWRLTGMPAAVHGLQGRGVIRTGAHADLVVIDPQALRAEEHTVAKDFPADSERYFVAARGYEMVVVNGVPVMEKGVHTGALPGHVIRGA